MKCLILILIQLWVSLPTWAGWIEDAVSAMPADLKKLDPSLAVFSYASGDLYGDGSNVAVMLLKDSKSIEKLRNDQQSSLVLRIYLNDKSGGHKLILENRTFGKTFGLAHDVNYFVEVKKGIVILNNSIVGGGGTNLATKWRTKSKDFNLIGFTYTEGDADEFHEIDANVSTLKMTESLEHNKRKVQKKCSIDKSFQDFKLSDFTEDLENRMESGCPQ